MRVGSRGNFIIYPSLAADVGSAVGLWLWDSGEFEEELNSVVNAVGVPAGGVDHRSVAQDGAPPVFQYDQKQVRTVRERSL